MSKRKEIEDWLKNDQDQLLWAQSYMWKKNISLSIDRGYQHVLDSLRRHGEEQLRRMRLAWNQHGSKVKRKSKTYSFTLSKEAGGLLKQMARSRPLSHVIELLLKDLDRLKREVRQQAERQHRLELMRRQRAFKDLNDALTAWKDKTDQLLTEWSRQRILLNSHGLDAVNGLSEEQSHQALPLYEQAMQGFAHLQKKWEKAVKLHDSLSLIPPMSRQRHPLGAASMKATPTPANPAVSDSE
jgi:hypothetical protein